MKPVLCIHGTVDKYVHHEQAEWLIAKLKTSGVAAELLLLEGAGHGFKGEDAARADKAMLDFFSQQLKK